MQSSDRQAPTYLISFVEIFSRVDTGDVRDDAHLIARLRYEFDGEIEYVGTGVQRELVQQAHRPKVAEEARLGVCEPRAEYRASTIQAGWYSALDIAEMFVRGIVPINMFDAFRDGAEAGAPTSEGCSCFDNVVVAAIASKYHYLQWSWCRCEEHPGKRCWSGFRWVVEEVSRRGR